MFQEFRTQNRTHLFDNCFIYCLDLCICFINRFFHGIVRCQLFPVITMQRFDFKNSIITTILFLVMNLNLYLTSE